MQFQFPISSPCLFEKDKGIEVGSFYCGHTFYNFECLGRFLKPITIQSETLDGMFVTNITSKK
jgi:hypothetical protein